MTKMLHYILFIITLVLSSPVMAANWTREESGLYYIPQFSPLKKDDLTNFKVRITDKNPYAQTGIFLKNGQLNLNDNSVTARTSDDVLVNLQFDAQNFYPNGTVRFAIVTVEQPKDVGDEFEIILSKGSREQAPLPFVKPLKPAFSVIIDHPKYGKKTVQSTTATPESKPWRSGNLVDIRRYYASVSPDFMVEFDITTFKNGMVATDIVMRYDRLYNTPMKSMTYSAKVLYNNKPYKNLANIKQNHHSKFRIAVRFGYKSDNITALNMQKIMDTRALARYDVTYGIDENIIDTEYEALKTAHKSIKDGGFVNMAMPTTGARPEIALLPEWTVRYLLTAHDKARKIVLTHGDIAAYIPWHFVDEKTNTFPLPHTHPKLYIEGRATPEENGIEPYDISDTGWQVDTAHQPSLSYIPYLITGDRYYYDNLVAAYTWTRFAIINNWGILREPMLRTQSFEQVRAYGWMQRLFAETALVTPDNTPLAKHLKKQIDADITYFEKGQIEGLEYEGGKYGNPNGELTGSLYGFTDQENPLFMQNFAAIGIGFHANAGLNPRMKTVSAFQVGFISGIFLQINNGFPPEYGAGYKFLQFIPDAQKGIELLDGKKIILNSWAAVFNHCIKSGYFKEVTAEIQQGRLPGYDTSASLFVGYSRAAQAMLFNVTKNPKALEAYGFLAQYLPRALPDYHVNPAYMIVPELNGGYLTYNRMQIGENGDDNLVAEANYTLLHGGNGNDNLLLEQFAGVAFGGGGDDFITAGKQDSYLYGGGGEDTLIADKGNDYLKGDEDYGKEKDIFIFTQVDFGDDIIADFTPDSDKIKFTPDTGIKSYYHDSTLYGATSDKKDNKKFYRQTINPQFDDLPSNETLTPEQRDAQKIIRKKRIEELLSQEARGNKRAAKKLNIQSTINVGIQNYIRPDGNGGTYIDLNINRTPEEKQKMQSSNNRFGTIHLPNTPPTKLKSSDFIFAE